MVASEPVPDRTLRPELLPEDERALRPQTLADFVGQEAAKANLRVFIESARRRGQAMDHTLFYGPPGLGKTTLAQIMARELGVNFRMTSGPVLAKAGDLAAILTNLEHLCDVLMVQCRREPRFIEEHLHGDDVVRALRCDQLEHDVALEHADARRPRDIDPRHPAGGERREDLVLAETCG